MTRLAAVLPVLVSLLLAQVALAQSTSDTEAVAAANQLYESGRFQDAGQIYQRLVDSGVRNTTVYYNLGNSYYKQGDLGRAIANFRRAQGLAPRDGDVRANLELARAQTLDQLEPDESGLVPLVVEASARFTLSELASAAFGLWVVLAVLLGILLLGSSERVTQQAKRAAIMAAIVLIVVGAALAGRIAASDEESDAVVVLPTVDVSSGPGTQYVTEFALHAGAEVSLVEERATWVRLALRGGQLEGWVPTEAVERVALQ